MNFKLLMIVVLVLIGAYNFNVQKIYAQELDPNILWVADSSIGRIDGFAVHPNGNIFAYTGNIISEINGADGKLVRKFTVPSESNDIESIDISDDGRYLATSYNDVIIRDLTNDVSNNVGIGNLVTFSPDSKKIAFRARGGVSKGHDSSIVILDLETDQRTYIRTEEMIHKIVFSPDGRFFTTGGSGQDIFGKFYTTLKLWDANTLKLIKELEKYTDQNYQITQVEFSQDGREVGFLVNNGLQIFSTETYQKEKHYAITMGSERLTSFNFITNDLLLTQSKETMIVRLDDDNIKTIFESYNRSFARINYKKDVVFVWNSFSNPLGHLIALDLDKILSSVNNIPQYETIKAAYYKGILNISGIHSVSNNVNIEIFDINGKLVSQLDLQPNGSELTTPLKLPNGTYLVNLKDGNNVYSGKFLVVE